MYNPEKNLPLLASLIAKGIVTCAVGDVATGTATVASAGLQVVKAFAPDVTEHFISALDYAKLKAFLVQTHPGELNQELDKLIKSALIRAIGFIKRLYLDKLKEEQQLTIWQKFDSHIAQLETVLSAMERDLQSQLGVTSFDKGDLEAYFTGEQTGIYEELTTYLFTVSGVDESDAQWQQLRTFFSQQLPLLFDVAFKEALKDENNTAAFKAFEIWILEEGLRNQKQQLASQEHILMAIETLAAGQLPEEQSRLLEQWQADADSGSALFVEQLDTILTQMSRIEQTITTTEAIVSRTEGKVDQANEVLDQVYNALKAGEIVKRLIPRELTNIPPLGGEFIGRDEDLRLLKETLTKSAKVVLMNGIGGIGKTTLARQFTRQHLAHYDHVCWLEVTKQDTVVEGKLVAGSFKEALADNTLLFANLGLVYNPKDESADERFALVTNALRNLPGRNLLVVDNAGADVGGKFIRDQLPQPPSWQVMLTSRQRLAGYEVLPLGTLSPAAAQQLFHTYYTFDCLAGEVVDLLEAIGYHTLTVELFAKTLEAHHGMLTVGELLQKVQSKVLNDPALQRQVETEHYPEETEVFMHLMLAFDCTELTDEERVLLNKLTFMPPEPYTVRGELAMWLDYTTADELSVLASSLDQLERKGWLTKTDHAYSVHRLIQQVLIYQLDFAWEPVKRMIGVFTEVLDIEDNLNVLPVYALRRHAEFILKRLPDSYQNAVEASELKVKLALIYKRLGKYKEAAILLEAVLTNYKALFGPANFLVARAQSDLGTVYMDLGLYSEAASLLETALENNKRQFGLDHPNVANRISILGMAYKGLGRQKEAIQLLQSAVEYYKSKPGSSPQDISRNQSNLAVIHHDLHQYREAASLLEEALVSTENQRGDSPHELSTLRSNLALVYKDMGRMEEAVDLLEVALESDTRNFGPDHPDTVIRQANLAIVYQGMGRIEEAINLLEDALERRLRYYGINHPFVASNQSSLAMAYRGAERYEEAAILMETALKWSINNFSETHPDIFIKQVNLSLIYRDLGRYSEAVALREEALKSEKNRFEIDDVKIIESNFFLAGMYNHLKQYKKAVEYLELVISGEEKALGRTHPRVAKNRMRLGVALFETNQISRAGIQFQMAEEMLTWHFGRQHPDAENCRIWLTRAKHS